MKKHLLRRHAKGDEDTRGMRGDEEEEGGGRRRKEEERREEEGTAGKRCQGRKAKRHNSESF